MNTIDRLLIAFVLVLAASNAARASVLSTGTPPIVVVDNVGQIIRFGHKQKLPPFPKVGSAYSSYIFQFEVHSSADYSQEMYVTIERGSCDVGFGFEQCWVVETTGQVGGVRNDPIRTMYAFPGDTVDVAWYGPGDPVEFNSNWGAPFWEVKNDNASHMQLSSLDWIDLWAGPAVDGYFKPYVLMHANSTWSTFFAPTYEHNAWGDLPAATEAGNVCRQLFLDYYRTADQVTHYVHMDQPNYRDPAFVNFAGNSIPGANIAVSTTNIGGQIWSMVTTYGGQ